MFLPQSESEEFGLSAVIFFSSLYLTCLIISRINRIPMNRAFQAWLPTLLSSVIPLAFAYFVFQPFLYESFIIPTNAMAPTLLGHHHQDVCPECNSPNYGSIVEGSYRFGNQIQICDNFHVTEVSEVDSQKHSGDHIIVAKYLNPKRWDLVVFQYPASPSVTYVKRLVGLPGEKIQIQGGAVWADGKKLTPPDSILGLEYLSEIEGGNNTELWGSPEKPAQLGDDEYFMLGDFSTRSADSRYWQKGAPEHNPFAVPESYLKGVVTHIYWPFHRQRILK
ncbi:MAG: signal peptidase I [Planctomycetes bacterium]|nr:signal peptidase I [Planctomycetota bacterium]MCH9726413.1 signal peptidase I [Planctomycetota bacterium]